MLIAIILLLIGFLVLALSADRLIAGASELALGFGVAPLTIGLTLVAFGTSLPEIVVSITAVIHGNPTMAIGNVIGSNIANIALVLGVTLLIIPMKPSRNLVWREFPILFIAMLLVSILMIDGHLGRYDGLLMIVVVAVILYFIFSRKKIETDQPLLESTVSKTKAWFWFVVGVIFLPLSSILIIKSSVYVAEKAHVPDLVIGLTILALGTSLPELATSLAGARKKQYDLVMGNIIGSNIFNLLIVLALPAFIMRLPTSNTLFTRDLPMMIVISLFLMVVLMFRKRGKTLGKTEGVLLVLLYIIYFIWLLCF